MEQGARTVRNECGSGARRSSRARSRAGTGTARGVCIVPSRRLTPSPAVRGSRCSLSGSTRLGHTGGATSPSGRSSGSGMLDGQPGSWAPLLAPPSALLPPPGLPPPGLPPSAGQLPPPPSLPRPGPGAEGLSPSGSSDGRSGYCVGIGAVVVGGRVIVGTGFGGGGVRVTVTVSSVMQTRWIIEPFSGAPTLISTRPASAPLPQRIPSRSSSRLSRPLPSPSSPSSPDSPRGPRGPAGPSGPRAPDFDQEICRSCPGPGSSAHVCPVSASITRISPVALLQLVTR